ncbi:hypothetical protein CHU93_11270 [Sandarakinorhabdus cyanobacteriorum]|uniref:Ribonuclease VapC n=1 Tax=Sandarakinorhabdus cyanobacteriorum TaxID=1981098 RepID=A0A255YD33_9SPHN|nr:type II toxin-antitoxin system VapC family toxin [Sandarakinorhabdus cyanobacteriorum]OYQ27083.1 hypothetical protein CHU93_11270 [Sandarakinorhabdus cyanobacteriorum]
MSIYLDASVLVPLFHEEASTAAVTRLMADQAQSPIISRFAAGETASAFSRLWRMALINRETADAMLAGLDRLIASRAAVPTLHDADIGAAADLVRRFALKLRLPDAIHLAVCMRRGLILATLDDLLADAARALGVAHIVPA